VGSHRARHGKHWGVGTVPGRGDAMLQSWTMDCRVLIRPKCSKMPSTCNPATAVWERAQQIENEGIELFELGPFCRATSVPITSTHTGQVVPYIHRAPGGLGRSTAVDLCTWARCLAHRSCSYLRWDASSSTTRAAGSRPSRPRAKRPWLPAGRSGTVLRPLRTW
jgi:hypothetical protein